ncbi:hypothetical protein PVAND_000608 [Polypedilum vanderplanki]|uniref:Uncharacterized protein n=1 Tax=Polypedilum vanderplanki TaxID=319348 RepID=A0A9J6BLS9_POLVA|nr:hypothetical protein PVAND_000608 [Polypedilum vanderplanki]
MDKFSLISAGLFSTAGICAIIAISSSEWIVEVGNNSKYGLMWSCLTLVNRTHQICYTPVLSVEWLITLILIFLGIICITTVVILLFASRWDRNVIFYARWIGFTAMVVFCLAAVIFPLGFYIEEINGAQFQLPNSHQVGISYIFFILALWITVISELFAGKICLPHF